MIPLPPSQAAEISTSNYLALIPVCAWFILIVYSICSEHVQAREDSTERASHDRSVRRRCDYGVSSASVLTDDRSLPSVDEVGHARNDRSPTSRGRQLSAVASDQGSNELFARASSSIEGDRDQLNDDPANADSTAQRTRSIPIPEPSRAIYNLSPSRHSSLPNYERTPSHPTETTPLNRGLYTGSRDFTWPTIQWFILFIEVDDKRGSPERNLHCFQEMFKLPTTEPTIIYFDSLAGHKATPENIKTKLASLYMRAGCVCDNSMVLVFLSGTGDETNRMCLLNDEFVTEDNVRGWISDVRRQSGLTNVQTVPIIFDICRVNKDVPSPEGCRTVELMWSCSRGQQAHALGFDKGPNSCFILALFWAAYGISHSNSSGFEEVFRFRLGQLVRIRRYSHDFWLQELGQCEECGIGSKCTSPGPQDPEGRQAGWDVLARLGALIVTRYPEYVQNIIKVLDEEMRQCKIWEASQAASSVSGSQSEAIAQHVGC